MSSADACDAQPLFVCTSNGLGARGFGVRLDGVQCRVLRAGRCAPSTGSVRRACHWCRPTNGQADLVWNQGPDRHHDGADRPGHATNQQRLGPTRPKRLPRAGPHCRSSETRSATSRTGRLSRLGDPDGHLRQVGRCDHYRPQRREPLRRRG